MNGSASGHGPLDRSHLPNGFWRRLPSAPRRLLLIDYDGTLVPFRAEREEARLPDPMRERVQRAVRVPGTYLTIVSGRRMDELGELLGPLRAHVVGEHGWEDRTVDGRTHVRHVPPTQAKVLGEAARAARAHGWGDHLERKRCSIVLHTRALPLDLAAGLERDALELWEPMARQHGLEVGRIDGGVELKVPVSPGGNAISDVADDPDTLPVYLCGDLNAGVLDPLHGRGIVIGVGPGPSRSTRFHLDGTEEVCGFLERWSKVRPPFVQSS